jgi:hypothetical protein
MSINNFDWAQELKNLVAWNPGIKVSDDPV